MIERRLKIEQLERRLPLAADFGDAPAPYDTLLADNGPSHEAVGPMLGASRDTEVNGLPSINADSDGTDDDGVTFGTIRVGELGANVIVNVQNAPTGAKLDAWIDFNGDGSWSGASEQIAASVSVVEGDNIVEFDVPVGIVSGTTFARLRLSTAGDLKVTGAAVDGEVEDYAIEISSPRPTLGFVPTEHVIDVPTVSNSYHVVDLDGDGDQDLISSAGSSVRWLENDGAGNMTEHALPSTIYGFFISTAGDLDLDGDVDIISVSPATGVMCWFKNHGSNGFTQHNIPTPAADPKSIELADWDGDGDLDIISVSPNRGFVAYVNNGNQTFTEQVVLPSVMGSSVSGIYAVYPIDMDRDGDLDVVAMGRLPSESITWYENNGAQQFTEKTSNPLGNFGSNTQGTTPRDMDGDGDIDVAFAVNSSSTDIVGWLENNGAQVFTRRVISYEVADPTAISVADVNGDGHQDILVFADSRNAIELFVGDENQNFSKMEIADATDDYNFSDPIVADFDGDGDLDIVTSDSQRKIVWYEAYPTAFHAAVSLPTVVEDSGVSSSVIFTRTGDATAEETIAFTVLGSATFGIDYTVSGAASFTTTVSSITFLAGESTATLQMTPLTDSDFDGDETIIIRIADYADIGLPALANNPTDAVITILHDELSDFGDAPNSFHTTTANNGASHGASGPTLGATRDSEADGQPTANADGDGSDDDGVTFGTIRTGQQNATVTVNVQNAPAGARLDAWFDFDGDGNFSGAREQVVTNLALVEGDNAVPIDIPATIGSGQIVARFRLSTAGGLQSLGYSVDGEVEDHVVTILPPATSDGVFSTRPPISTTAVAATDVVAADLDGDGDVDVISVTNPTIDWHENLGNDQFVTHSITATLRGGNDLAVVDLDRDGDLDLLVTARSDRMVAWYENDGDQNFTQHILTTSLNSAEDVHAADMDSDGDLDVVALGGQPSSSTGNVVWFENDGEQNFSPMQLIAETKSTMAIALGDLDGDNDIDIVATNTAFPALLAILINDGHGHFDQGVVSGPIGLPNVATVAISDLDSDGDGDIIYAATGPLVAWFENDGIGNFSSWIFIDTTTSITRLMPADVDGDGHLDLVAASYVSSQAVWYKNSGASDPTFTRMDIAATAKNAWAIDVGDLDGDGDLDVVTPAYSGGRIEWFENIPANSGDFDGDGDVDGRDFLAWQRGQSPTPLSADDLADWKATYGYVSPAPEIVALLADEPTAVAEPFVDSETPTTNAPTMALPSIVSTTTSASPEKNLAGQEVSHEHAHDKFFGELGTPSARVRDFGDIAISRLARKKIPLALSASAFED